VAVRECWLAVGEKVLPHTTNFVERLC